jgi:hypothetical protein
MARRAGGCFYFEKQRCTFFEKLLLFYFQDKWRALRE